MTRSSLQQLASDLTVAVRYHAGNARLMDTCETPSAASLPRIDCSTPQVIIYTRKVDPGFDATFVSDNIECQLGYLSKQFTTEPSFWADRIHPEDARTVLSGMASLPSMGHRVLEYRFMHADGRYRWIRDEANYVSENGQGPAEILGTLIDISERKRTQEALEESESRYRSLVETSPMGMISFDRTGEITEFNPAVLKILGAANLGQAEAKDLFTLLPMVEAGISEAILECLESGRPNIGEFQLKSKAGRDIHTRVHVVPIREEQGTVSGAHAFIEDISDQKRAEELIVRSERLKVLGQISGGVGHNFTNLLQIVAGNANMALTNLGLKDYPSIKLNLEQILESSSSATEAVRWLQQFGRDDTGKTQPQEEIFDLSNVVQQAVEMCRLWSRSELERNDIRINHELDLTRGCHVKGVPDQLAWVTLNLLKNAVEAMPGGGEIRVSTYLKDDQVILKVRDAGMGIPADSVLHITKAFWTSKQGHAGMGLAFNVEILRKHGGTMGVKRMKPHGTTFTVRLPYVEPRSANGKSSRKSQSHRGLKILLIDDEAPVAKLFEKGMRLLGQTVVPAFSGAQGLTLFKEGKFDAVICGLAMPGMNGLEVASAIRQFCLEKDVPKPPFIILTGCATSAEDQAVFSSNGVDRGLQKPITVPGLLDVIRSEVNKAASESSFSGKVDGIDLLEYLQLIMLNGKKGVLEIVSRQGAEGAIFFDKGEIRHAVSGELEGEEALYRCLTFKGGSFSGHPWREPERITISKPGQFLLMEAARKRDEMRGDSLT